MHDLIPSNQHCFTHDLILPAPIAMDNHDMLREIAADHVCIFAVMVIMESNLCGSMWPLSSRAGVVSGRCQGKTDDVTADTKRNDTKKPNIIFYVWNKRLLSIHSVFMAMHVEVHSIKWIFINVSCFYLFHTIFKIQYRVLFLQRASRHFGARGRRSILPRWHAARGRRV